MAAYIGRIEAFDETIEPWSSYVERLGQYFKANKVDDSLKVASLLSLIGGKTYNFLRTLTSPTKPAEKSYQEIIKLLEDHLSPKTLSIAERFRFHKHKQLEGESINDYVAVRKVSLLNIVILEIDLPMILETDLFVECVMKTFKRNYCQRLVKPCVEKVNIPMELDTGSAVSVISHVDYCKYFPTLPLDSTSVTLKTYSGEKIIPEGVMHVNVQYNNQRANLDLYVVRKGGPPLFGREWLHHFQLNWKEIKSLKISVIEFENSESGRGV
jgi:hypothetical protein